MIPTAAFVTKGTGRHKEKLSSFELALRNAGIAQFNLVKVSSIFPPGCSLVGRNRGLSMLSSGQITFVVMSENSTNEPSRLIAASTGLAVPKDRTRYGYISEHHSYGQKEAVAGEYAEDLAAYMLATTLDAPFDPDKSYDEQKDIWQISGHKVKSRNVTQTAVGDKNGLWTTVITAVVFCSYSAEAVS